METITNEKKTTISISKNLKRYIMDHKDADHKSAEAVIYGLIGENDELKKELKCAQVLISRTPV